MSLKDFIVRIDRESSTSLEIAGVSAKGQFEFDVSDSPRTQQVLEGIETGDCKNDDLREIGAQLFAGLFSGELATLFERERAKALGRGDHIRLRLMIPPGLWSLPWEALYDEGKRAFLAGNPNYSLIRDTLEETEPFPERSPAKFPLNILVVMPEGSRLQVEREWSFLSQAFGEFENRHEVVLERLDGRVTPDRLREKLRQRVDILHYIGHGEMNVDDEFSIHLNDPTGSSPFPLDADTFASLFSKTAPRLVVLNCCMGGDAEQSPRGLSGIGAHLMKAFVPATVAMRYEVPDPVAIRFTDVFYRELLSGERPGRIDIALAQARHSLYVNRRDSTVRGFITPVLYLAPGAEQLFVPPDREKLVHDPPHETAQVFPDTTEQGARIIPRELCEALEARECIPILGSGILKLSAVRQGQGQAIPNAADLVQSLATEKGYPLESEPPSVREGDARADFFPSLCQYLQRGRQRHVLIRALQQAYQNIQPPERMLLLAGLNVPAFVYLHFDELLEHALILQKRLVQSISSVDRSFELDPKATLLLYLRGTLQDADSLVLTEDDHERLWDRIGAMSSRVRELMKGRAGRSALILGVSPRDQLLKRFAARMLDAGENRNQGPTFFVSTDHTRADDAYWEKYNVRWLPLDPDHFVDGLKGLAS